MIRELVERLFTGPAPDLVGEERVLNEMTAHFDQVWPRSTDGELAVRQLENLARIEQKLALQRALGMTLLSGIPASKIDPVDFVDQFLDKLDQNL